MPEIRTISPACRHSIVLSSNGALIRIPSIAVLFGLDDNSRPAWCRAVEIDRHGKCCNVGRVTFDMYAQGGEAPRKALRAYAQTVDLLEKFSFKSRQVRLQVWTA